MSANVITWHLADEQPDSLIGRKISGRALDLQAAMLEWSADTVGIQEARDRHGSQRSRQHVEVFAGTVAQRHGGVQLWVHIILGIPANRIRVTSHSAWTFRTCACEGRAGQARDVVAGDHCNCTRTVRLARFHLLRSGPLEEDAGGELVHDFLDKCDLMAANTFDDSGRRTWVPSGGQEARIDYVVCPQRWLPMLHRAGTADFSLAIADKEDHRPAFAKFVLHEECEMADECEADRNRIMFDRARLRQAECREHFCHLFARAPPMPADVSVDNHELLLTTF